MSRRLGLWTGLLLLAAGVGLVAIHGVRYLTDTDSYQPRNHFPVSREVHWEFNVRNQTNQALHDVEFFSFLPLPDTWQQSLVSVTASHPIEKHLNGSQLPIARIRLESIPPYGQRNIRLEVELAMADHFENGEHTPIEHWLKPEPLIESDHEGIVRLARQLDRGEAEQTSWAIYQWLVAEVAYGGYDPVDRGALYALEHRKGDCSEYAALAVALARASGLPARLVSGYPVSEHGRLSPFAFHAWAEIRLEDRWLILDAQERRFDPGPEHYLVTQYGTSRSGSTDWARFGADRPGVVIEMR